MFILPLLERGLLESYPRKEHQTLFRVGQTEENISQKGDILSTQGFSLHTKGKCHTGN